MRPPHLWCDTFVPEESACENRQVKNIVTERPGQFLEMAIPLLRSAEQSVREAQVELISCETTTTRNLSWNAKSGHIVNVGSYTTNFDSDDILAA